MRFKIKVIFAQVLILADNQLDKFDFANTVLSCSLQKLDLSKNSFIRTPKLRSFRRLATLDMGHNKLIQVPDSFPPSLRYLTLRGNQINFNSLPRRHQFEHLDLTENPFAMRPRDVIKMPKIKMVPKMQEIASRAFLKLGFTYNNRIMAQVLVDYLDKAVHCPCSNVSLDFFGIFLCFFPTINFL